MTLLGVGRNALRVLSAVRERLRDEVGGVVRTTESETLAVGQQIQRVVDVARGTITQLRGVLSSGGTRDSDLVTSIRQLADQTRHHNEAMTKAVASNLAQVARVAEQLQTITQAARSVEILNASARVLSLNALIEASRASSAGTAFKTIAGEMHQLSREISATNTQITDLADAMGQTLPLLETESRSLADMVGRFAVTTRAEIESVDRGVCALQAAVQTAQAESDRALADMVSALFAAISKLQFQDVCSQQLRLTDLHISEAHREVAAMFGIADHEIDQAIPPANYETLGRGGDRVVAEAGDVMMF